MSLSGLSLFFFFKQKTAYEMRISDWSSDVCSSDLPDAVARRRHRAAAHRHHPGGRRGADQLVDDRARDHRPDRMDGRGGVEEWQGARPAGLRTDDRARGAGRNLGRQPVPRRAEHDAADRDPRRRAPRRPRRYRARPLPATPPGVGPAPVGWSRTAPETTGQSEGTGEAGWKNGKARDRLVFEQAIEPGVPVETWAASLFRVGPNTTLPIAIPAGALPGGTVDIALADTLAPPLTGVRDYMSAYPYTCFEQQRSAEHTSELQSLMRISYAVFCLTKKITTQSILLRHPQP